MKIHRGADFSVHEPTAVTIGNFDGLHIGHRELISGILRYSGAMRLSSAVLSFKPHPAAFFSNKPNYKTLLTPAEKEFLLDEAGVDIYAEYPFNGETAGMTPEEFIKTVLVKRLNARVIVVGEGFRFGKGSEGSASALKRFAEIYGLDIITVGHKSFNGEKISSSVIKELLIEKKLDEVKKYMGRSYFVMGNAVNTQNGGLSVFPPECKLLPPDGKYDVKISFPGKTNPAVDGNVLINGNCGDTREIELISQAFEGNGAVAEGGGVFIEF